MSRLAELKQERRDLKQKARALVDAVEENDVSDLDGIESVDEADRLADEVIEDLEDLDAEIDRVEEKREKLAGIGGTDEDTADEPENEPRAGRTAFEDVNVHDDRIGRESENDPEEVAQRSFRKWLSRGPMSLRGKETELIGSGAANEVDFNVRGLYRTEDGQIERRSTAAIFTSPDTKGGALVPTEFMQELFQDIEDMGQMRDVARVFRTDNGRNMDVPLKRDNTAQGEYVGEGSTIGTTTDIQFGSTQMVSHNVRSGPIGISFEADRDAAFNLESEVRQELARRINNFEENEFAQSTVTTTTAINGIKAASTVAAVTVSGGGTSSSDLTFTDLQDLQQSVKIGWRRQGNPVWLMSQDAWGEVKKLADADNVPFINRNLTEGFEARLLGDPVVVNEFMDDFKSSGSTNEPIFYGDFSQYVIRDVNRFRLVRFDEKFANEGKVAFQGFAWVDARPLLGSTDEARHPYRMMKTST